MVNYRVPKTKAEWKRVVTTDTEFDKSSQWINEDLAPTPKNARTYSW